MKVLFTFLYLRSPNLIENDHILCIKYQPSNTLSHVCFEKMPRSWEITHALNTLLMIQMNATLIKNFVFNFTMKYQITTMSPHVCALIYNYYRLVARVLAYSWKKKNGKRIISLGADVLQEQIFYKSVNGQDIWSTAFPRTNCLFFQKMRTD